jgi:gluconolactonase
MSARLRTRFAAALRALLRPHAPVLALLVLPTVQDPIAGPPAAVVDLATREGAALVQGQWRYADVKITEVDGRGVGPDLKPSGAPLRTYDYEPKATGDGPAWTAIEPTTLDTRRGNGRVSFAWYRIGITVPQRVGRFDPTGGTVVFEIVIDDYAEVWVNGQLPLVLGQAGGQVVKGFNAPNRVVLTRDARPGQHFDIAVFGMNGPISASPQNFIWVKSATLDFYPPPPPPANVGHIERTDPALDAIVAPDAVVEHLASGFQFIEGPVWVRDPGYLLFSDPNNNVIYRWVPESGLSIYRTKSGYSGVDIGDYHQPGSNGLTLDREGRLTVDEHGRRRVVRLERNGQVTVLADRYDGKRLNSPNDLVYKSDGALYFTDPPFGLPQVFDDPRKELPYSGVFRVKDGVVTLLTTDLKGPNGLAFSPDERFLYVDDWDPERKVVVRYPVNPDGTLGAGEEFFSVQDAPGEEALDGLKVDQQGNLYVSGPGGVWIVSPQGKHLGTIVAPELPANFAWGDADGKTLYLAARTGLYRVRLNVAGIRP